MSPLALPTRLLTSAAGLTLAALVVAPTAHAATAAPAAPVGPESPAVPAATVSAAAASGFLAAQLAAGEHHLSTSFNGQSFADYGLTADAILALAATHAGRTEADAATAYLRDNAAAYIGAGTETYAGATGKLLTVAVVQGATPTAFGGIDLVARLKATEKPTGRFTDVSTFGDYSNTLGQSWALLGLSRAGVTPTPASVAFLRAQQCADGGFRLDEGATTPCASDTDATSLAVQALVATAGAKDPAVTKATAYLAAHLDKTGGLAGTGPTAVVNTNTTGLAAAAFTAAGDTADAAKTRGFLAGMSFDCTAPVALQGGLAYTPADKAATAPTDQIRRATAQGAVGLLASSYVTVSAAGSTAAPVTLTCSTTPAPAPTATTTTPAPAPTATTTVPVPAPTATTTAPAPVPTTAPTSGATPAPTTPSVTTTSPAAPAPVSTTSPAAPAPVLPTSTSTSPEPVIGGAEPSDTATSSDAAPSTESATTAEETLPVTGAPVAALTSTGAGLVILGSALVGFARRRTVRERG